MGFGVSPSWLAVLTTRPAPLSVQAIGGLWSSAAGRIPTVRVLNQGPGAAQTPALTTVAVS